MTSDTKRVRNSLSRLKRAEGTLLELGSNAARNSYIDAWVAHRRVMREVEQTRFSERRDRGDFD